ncbi:SafA/ExsA family spore coat assembly protein [Alteribacillus iranensis]|uniref:Morphogenetic protein associated with SpoVID n=1 Tax=Alteribacillus iranensis TaxID=930128 RepID=A0A1I1Z589_9BACI|nr:SafA/ExsA family spore coat assembly protein [Alteribacillus iranensis]SFE26976.1 morphogenetic protein associated with SpoVID [Alteribacillus iranensis]
MQIHIVQKGDTLWNLSQQYGVNFEELKKANTHLADPDKIMPGMKIKIPAKGVPVKKESQKEAPQSVQPKEKEVKEEPAPSKPQIPPMYQPMPQQPKPPVMKPQQQEQHININTNIYKPQPPKKPQSEPQSPKEPKADEIKAKKPSTTFPKMEDANDEKVKAPKDNIPQPPAPPIMPEYQHPPVMPYMMPAPGPCHVVPVSPMMPGCSCGCPTHPHHMAPYSMPGNMMYPPVQHQEMNMPSMPHHYMDNQYGKAMPKSVHPSNHLPNSLSAGKETYNSPETYSNPYHDQFNNKNKYGNFYENHYDGNKHDNPSYHDGGVYSPWMSGYKRENEEK